MWWGIKTKTDYLKPYLVPNDGLHTIIKLGSKYFKYTGEGNMFKEVKPKYKKVIYFE